MWSSPTPLIPLLSLLAHLGRVLTSPLQYDHELDDGSSIRCGHPKYASVPCFDDRVKHNLVVQAGRTAVLQCIVYNAKMKAVTWDKKGVGPVAIGHMIFIRDDRYQVRRGRQTDWSLVISSARPSDSGIYRCQINLEKLKEKVYSLKVEEPSNSVLRGREEGQPGKSPKLSTDEFLKDQGLRNGLENKRSSVVISGRDVVYAGDTLQLSCMARYRRPMSDEAQLEWYHFGVHKRSNRGEGLKISYRILNSTTLNSLLLLTPVTADSSGPWVCVKRPTLEKKREYAEIKITVVKPVYTVKAAPKVDEGKNPDNASSRLLTSPLLHLLLLLLASPLLVDAVV